MRFIKGSNLKQVITLIEYFAILISNSLFAQNGHVVYTSAQLPVYDDYSKAIEDNSFLIEEAYNQEAGVVQHIFTGMSNFTPLKNWNFSFTQEWPLWNQTNQFSYTILYNSYNSGDIGGFGDLLLNYRYQLFGKEDFAAIAPRLSMIIPVGDKEKGFGNGTPGIQFNFPLSKRISEKFTINSNTGLTLYPNFTSNNINNEAIANTLTFYNAGVSIIWLAGTNINFMLEIVTGNNNSIAGNGDISYFNQTIINPGFRYAIDIHDFQIVPGLAFPITFAQSEKTSGVFLYLSFEHPF
jgi:hypothetical protein